MLVRESFTIIKSSGALAVIVFRSKAGRPGIFCILGYFVASYKISYFLSAFLKGIFACIDL